MSPSSLPQMPPLISKKLAVGFAQALRSLMAHCNTPEAGGITPSDFSNARLSQSDLDKLIAKLH